MVYSGGCGEDKKTSIQVNNKGCACLQGFRGDEGLALYQKLDQRPITMTFRQRIWLHSAGILRTRVRLNLKAGGWAVWLRKSQGSIVCGMCVVPCHCFLSDLQGGSEKIYK